MKRTPPGRQTQNGKTKHGRLKHTKLQRLRRGKASDRRRKGSQRERALRDLLLQDLLRPRLLEQTKLSPEARSCVADGSLFAMMTTKSKPTWRHVTWNSADHTVCPSQSRRRSSLFSSLKNFTLHFDNASQCESLDRLWFAAAPPSKGPPAALAPQAESAHPPPTPPSPCAAAAQPDQQSQQEAYDEALRQAKQYGFNIESTTRRNPSSSNMSTLRKTLLGRSLSMSR